MNTRALKGIALLLALWSFPTYVSAKAEEIPFDVMVRESDWIGVVRMGTPRDIERDIPDTVHAVYHWRQEGTAQVLEVLKGDRRRNLIIEFDNRFDCPDASFFHGSRYLVFLTHVAFGRYQAYQFYISTFGIDKSNQVVYFPYLYKEEGDTRDLPVSDLKERIRSILANQQEQEDDS